jgi:hypothetical protein
MYVRIRDALKTTGTIDQAICYTCGKLCDVCGNDCGHGIAGRTNGIEFDPDICRFQCHYCNGEKGGEAQLFKARLIAENGQEWWDRKQAQKREYLKTSDEVYRLMNTEWLRRIKELKEAFNG